MPPEMICGYSTMRRRGLEGEQNKGEREESKNVQGNPETGEN